MKVGVDAFDQIPEAVRNAFETLSIQIQAGWRRQHNGDGGHTNVTALSVSMGGFLIPASAVSNPPTITANVNDYVVPNLDTSLIVKLRTDAARNITGIKAPADRITYRRWQLRNTGGFDYVLVHASALSIPNNRLECPGAANVTVNPRDSVWIEYDPALARFVVEGL